MGAAIRDLVRERIIDTMMEMLRENNISRISMSQIAEKAGVSRMTVYRYFSDKYDIQKEILERDSREPLEQFAKDHDIVRLIQSSGANILRRREIYRNLFSNIEEQNSFFEQWVDNTRSMIIREIGPERMTDELNIALYFLLYGGFYVSWDCVLGKIDMDAEQLGRTIVACWPESIKKLLDIR